jgi:hypothetical protein
MSETLQPASDTIVTLAAAALSASPDLLEDERTARFQTVVRGVSEFQPADPAQSILVTLILGHHLTIMDGFRDLACLTLTPAEAAKARMVTVAQTKIVLQLARELRIARKEPLAPPTVDRAAAEPVQANLGYDAAMAKLMSAYGDTLATLRNADTLTPAAAEQARQTLSEALSPSPSAPPGATGTNSSYPPLTGSRAQRRAEMKRRGQFKRTA